MAKSASLFAEYAHTGLDKATLSMPAASPRFDYAWERQSDAVKIGVRVWF